MLFTKCAVLRPFFALLHCSAQELHQSQLLRNTSSIADVDTDTSKGMANGYLVKRVAGLCSITVLLLIIWCVTSAIYIL